MQQPDLDHPGLRSSSRLRVVRKLFGERLPARLLLRLCRQWEGGQAYSRTLRELLWERNGVIAGAYSYGPLLGLTWHPRSGLRVGRYVSMAGSVHWGFNHPLDRISTTTAFYAGAFGNFFPTPPIEPVLEIGHDAWIGDLVAITPSCRRIGVGAVIGAGAVVTRDIPDYAVAFGNPARVVRYRFDEELRRRLIESRWWELSLAELVKWQDALALPAASPQALVALGEIGAATHRLDDMHARTEAL
jgi:acetyltransferase-like isoleucine patch superfamily enzyme